VGERREHGERVGRIDSAGRVSASNFIGGSSFHLLA